MGPRLVFDQVSKRFGGVTALDRLSLEVADGEIIGFLGPNGAGKTTAIHLAMGFLLADGGHGSVLGEPFRHSRQARARIGYVPDAPVFFSGSAMDAVLLAAQLNGAQRASLREDARALLLRLDLPPEGRDARRFSRGMQQRLALAQALITRPLLLILDEPASALDPPGVALVREALREARDGGAAVFLSSHQLQEVERLCDRVIYLDRGRVVRAGSVVSLQAEGACALVTLRGMPGEPAEKTYRVPVSGQRAFLEQAWSQGAELLRVEREQGSLESLFEQDGVRR